MEIEWAQVLLGAIGGGGGIIGLVTQLWIFRTQLREEKRERALPDVVGIRLDRVLDSLEATHVDKARGELGRLSHDLKEILGLAILE